MKRILNFFILLHVFWTSASYGQSSEDDNDQYVVRNASPIVPASPNASSLGIYGNIPVGHYTGIPEIKIPLYEIETRDFTLPGSEYRRLGMGLDCRRMYCPGDKAYG